MENNKNYSNSEFQCEKYKTEQYVIIIGFIPGYQSDISSSQLSNIKKDFNIDYFNNLYRRISKNNPIAVVSGVIQKVLVSYPVEWGCPENGEPAYKITCTRNPKFNPSSTKFREAVLYNVEELQKELRQSTVTITETDIDMYYSVKSEKES